MKKNFEIRFCGCGRIHIISTDKLWDWMQEDYSNRKVLFVCTHCGSSSMMWLDDYEDGYATNSHDTREGIIDDPNMRVILSEGVRVYMNSGKIADTFQNGYYANCEEWKMIESSREFKSLNDSERDREDWATVNTDRLIRDVTLQYKDDHSNILKSISGYSVRIHWIGTEYETNYNK